jgi:hypothetical protein
VTDINILLYCEDGSRIHTSFFIGKLKYFKYFSNLRSVLVLIILDFSRDLFLEMDVFSVFHWRWGRYNPLKIQEIRKVDTTSPRSSLETSEIALWGRQNSLLFIHQTTWHYIPEGINLHKPFILLLTAFIFLSSSYESPMVQNRSAHKGADLWIYDRVSICFRSCPHGCLERRWVLELLFVEVKRQTSEFYYHHHLIDDISTAKCFFLHVSPTTSIFI